MMCSSALRFRCLYGFEDGVVVADGGVRVGTFCATGGVRYGPASFFPDALLLSESERLNFPGCESVFFSHTGSDAPRC